MTLSEFKAWFEERAEKARNTDDCAELVSEAIEKLATVKEPVQLPARLHNSTVYECTRCGCRTGIDDPHCACGIPDEVIRKDLLGNSKILKLRKYHYYEVD